MRWLPRTFRMYAVAITWLLPALILVGVGFITDQKYAFGLAAQFVAGFLIALLPIRRRILSTTCGFLIVCTLILATYTGLVAQSMWAPPVQNLGVIPTLRAQVTGEPITHSGSHSIALERPQDNLAIQFSTRWSTAQKPVSWFLSGSGTSAREAELYGNEKVTTFYFPKDGEDNYAMRTFTLDTPVRGRTFLAFVDLRTTGDTISRDCSGLWIQTWFDGGSRACSSPVITGDWTTFSQRWTAPSDSTTHVLRIVLNNLDGFTVESKNLRVFEVAGQQLTELMYPLPSVPYISLSFNGADPEVHSGLPLPTQREWTMQLIDLGPITAVPQVLSLELWTGAALGETSEPLLASGLKLVEVHAGGAHVASKRTFFSARQSLFQGHPNIAGHSVVALMALVAVVVQRRRQQLVLISLCMLLIVLTGSRSALLGAIVIVVASSIGVLELHKVRTHAGGFRAAWITTLLGLLGILLALPAFQREDVGASRSDIWAVALNSIREHPLTGTDQDFGVTWRAQAPPGSELVTHAHNLWLQFAFHLGMPGFVAVAFFSLAACVLAWRHNPLTGVAISVIFCLQIVDVTLVNAWVFYPFALTIASSYRMSKDFEP